MKRHGNLYQQICITENIAEAHKNARKGKRHYGEIKQVDEDPDGHFLKIQRMLINRTFRNSKYSVFKLRDSGKERIIHKLPYYPDRIIHHAIMQVAEPIWKRTMINDTFSSIRGRGIHKGLRRVMEAMKDEEGSHYCLKLDISKYYPSIDHGVLKQVIRRKIKDPDLLWLLDEIIDSAPGVPIGNYLSQYFANLYLSGFDHWMKETMNRKWYFRYCDDIVVFGHTKEELHALLSAIQDYLCVSLKLKVKPNHQVFPVEARGVDFLGYVFRHNYTLVRRRIRENCIKALKGNIRDIHKQLPSYFGWFVHCNSYNLRRSLVGTDLRARMNRYCQITALTNPLRGGVI